MTIHKSIIHEANGWSANVYFGQPWKDPVTGQWRVQNLRRYSYQTRDEARRADISHDIGQEGRVS